MVAVALVAVRRRSIDRCVIWALLPVEGGNEVSPGLAGYSRILNWLGQVERIGAGSPMMVYCLRPMLSATQIFIKKAV